MEILVLGGTEFVGRAVAEAAVARSWGVTVFHRGRHPAPEGARTLLGDRATGDLGALAAGEWDAVVDTWSAAAGPVAEAARALRGRVGGYAYVSSRSVYAEPAPARLDESAPVVSGEGEDYAAVKRAGELAAQRVYGDAALLVRAGLILGPRENVGRLPWWLNRIARGGDVLAPGPRDLPLQYVDARDLAAWTLDALAAGRGGPYNVVSPPGHTTMGELLAECAAVTGSDAVLRWAAPETVLAAGIEPWTQLPVWLPPGADHVTMHQGDVGKALAAGLRCRPVGETVADTWRWLASIGGSAPQRPDRAPVGLDPAVEARVLAALGG
ncbi:NAD-dependent epimerase/dehydratase family protein [Actinacidiphila yeochonensis]|uniref:NAD-dependent epimerase/dehydratase family protein n=1 Tax=Actinacidiphila yeochonensis TaxID=89050 RepID=UPI00056D38FE|nr:NAD-dependent epimerase/dehydratase family protein [Actinacidiphila yeochonensis]